MLHCEKAGHDRCSFKAALDNPWLQLYHQEIRPDDTLVYGTSDPTVNASEVWMLGMIAELACVREWSFFNCPLDERWLRFDLEEIFEPYKFPYEDNPFDVIYDIGLTRGVTSKFHSMEFTDALFREDPILDMKLEDLVAYIKDFREIKSFCVANVLTDDGEQKQVFGTKKSRLYDKLYRTMTLGELFERKVEKLGGTLIYFLIGYYTAKRGLVVLFPHNTRGDIWGAVSAGAAKAGHACKLYPIGGFDVMTKRQWDMWKKTSRWKKAPANVLQRLKTHPFRDTLLRHLIDRKDYCALSYDDTRDEFSFELDTP